MSRGVLMSAYGFPPIAQGNWKDGAIITDMDPVHAGPIIPTDGTVPSAVCLVNPMGYRVDVDYYRKYCDEHSIPLWFDNAACPCHLMPDGSNLIDICDAAMVSLHETKMIGRGEGGVLLVKPEHFEMAVRAINFGYDYKIHPNERAGTWHKLASNWRMSDVSAAAILMSWERNWQYVADYMLEKDDEVVDIGPFKRGAPGSFMNVILEHRKERPNFEIKYYYYPLLSREKAPNTWKLFDETQCRPFHPAGGPCPKTYYGPTNPPKPAAS